MAGLTTTLKYKYIPKKIPIDGSKEKCTNNND